MKDLTEEQTYFVTGTGQQNTFLFDYSLQEIVALGASVGSILFGLAGGYIAYYMISTSYSLAWSATVITTSAYASFMLGSFMSAGLGYVFAKVTNIEENCIFV